MARKISVRYALGRAAIHFFCSSSLVLGLFLLLRWYQPRTHWLPDDRQVLLSWSAVLVVFISWLREPHDVEEGDPAWKSYIDLASWLAGSAISYLMILAVMRGGL
jgi:hypothetical protein